MFCVSIEAVYEGIPGERHVTIASCSNEDPLLAMDMALTALWTRARSKAPLIGDGKRLVFSFQGGLELWAD